MTRAERERRRERLEYEAEEIVCELTQKYRIWESLQQARGVSDAEIKPVKAWLCETWERWERFFRPELRGLVRELFWDEGQRELARYYGECEERYAASRRRGN